MIGQTVPSTVPEGGMTQQVEQLVATGSDYGWWVIFAIAMIAIGALVVRVARES